jgi:hypothetical protein
VFVTTGVDSTTLSDTSEIFLSYFIDEFLDICGGLDDGVCLVGMLIGLFGVLTCGSDGDNDAAVCLIGVLTGLIER